MESVVERERRRPECHSSSTQTSFAAADCELTPQHPFVALLPSSLHPSPTRKEVETLASYLKRFSTGGRRGGMGGMSFLRE
eukprot:2345846-Rhodomonas_salina.2